jgi:DNA-binding winged helix-turn-helix (wHTH) protein
MNQVVPSSLFRQDLMGKVLATLNAGESCGLIGVGSVGKSNFLRAMMDPETTRHFLGNDSAKFLFLYVDGNTLVENSAWGVFELMLHRLVKAAEAQDLNELDQLETLYQRAIKPEDRDLAHRYLERGLGSWCGRLGFRLAFLLDDFDQVFREVEPRLFANLRALRDENKYRLMYVVASRDDLTRLRSPQECEHFYELFAPNLYGLGPYSETDARQMLSRLSQRTGVNLAPDLVRTMLGDSGGHPGLLRAMFWPAAAADPDSEADLWSDQGLIDECDRIWQSLGADEQRLLFELATGSGNASDNEPLLELVALKGLLESREDGAVAVFSPLFATFISEQEIVDEDGVEIVADEVRIEGRPLAEHLTQLEWRLLQYLYKHHGQICSRDEIIEAIYPDQSLAPGVPDNRLDVLVGRLRRKIEPDRHRPRYLISVRGRGFRLVTGAQQP